MLIELADCNVCSCSWICSRHRAFKSFEVQSGHPVKCISHSPSGDRFIVGTGSASPIIYDKEGQQIIKLIKGDMYIRDLVNTKVDY